MSAEAEYLACALDDANEGTSSADAGSFGFPADVSIVASLKQAAIRKLEATRTIALLGLSDVELFFSWNSDYYSDRTDVLDRLALMTLPLPAGVDPSLKSRQCNRRGPSLHPVQSPDHDLIHVFILWQRGHSVIDSIVQGADRRSLGLRSDTLPLGRSSSISQNSKCSLVARMLTGPRSLLKAGSATNW
jgi:hypothetical protein